MAHVPGPRTHDSLPRQGGAQFTGGSSWKRELPKDPNPTWMGYSVGHWEGGTLVVESVGFNDRAWLDR